MFLNVPTHSHLAIKHFRLHISLFNNLHWVIGLAEFNNLVIHNFRLVTSDQWIMWTRRSLLRMPQLCVSSEFHSSSPFLGVFRPRAAQFQEILIPDSNSRSVLVLLERHSFASQS